jgi:hypothetical protein
MKFDIWVLFRKFVEKGQVLLKSDKNKSYFTWRPIYIYATMSLILRMRFVSVYIWRQNQNTHFVLNNFFFENRPVCEIMWKNTVESDGPKMTIWRMHIACWIPKVTNTHSEYVILIAFPPQQWLHERASMLCHTYIDCLVTMKVCLMFHVLLTSWVKISSNKWI